MNHDWIKRAVEKSLHLFPRLLNVPEGSRDPQVVVFYHAAMLVVDVVLLIPVVLLSLKYRVTEHREGRGDISAWKVLKLSACALLMVVMAIGIFRMGYGDGRGVALWYSRYSLAFAAVIYHLGLLFSLNGAAVVIFEMMVLFGIVNVV
ncbi:hypothetical protein [Pandoraea commovens]|uniref:Uncharacterized protein n=1 Tax=Pandoraea commovens TaxID=2508289 RepID=A0ABY5QND9_9BURK|nr:hypothetical protein [Pandoraea commovens]UVA81400.1 hypothetical protein NTU39_10500 [Pandoraea commovens]